MYFNALAKAFDDRAIDELGICADRLLARARSDRTSLAHHLANPAARLMIVATVKRFYDSPLPEKFVARFGKTPALNLVITTIRLQAPEDLGTRVDWHLDLNFVADNSPFLVAWIPLEDVGRVRPGLELCLPTASITMRAMLTPWQERSARGASLEFSDAELASIFGENGYRSRPVILAAGGAVVFDQFVFHRTERMPSPTQPRRSFEFRMVDVDALPKTQRQTRCALCRPNPDAEQGIEFLVKSARGSLRPVAHAAFDDPDAVFRD